MIFSIQFLVQSSLFSFLSTFSSVFSIQVIVTSSKFLHVCHILLLSILVHCETERVKDFYLTQCSTACLYKFTCLASSSLASNNWILAGSGSFAAQLRSRARDLIYSGRVWHAALVWVITGLLFRATFGR